MKLPTIRLTAATVLAASLAACSSTPERNPEPEPRLAAAVSEPLTLSRSSRGPVLSLDDMLFEFEKAELSREAKAKVAQAAAYLRDNPERIAMIEGHTDDIGEASYNEWLAQVRTDHVRDEFLDNGINANRLLTRSYGEIRPIANNDTREGRQANRRVEIVFTRKN